MINLVTPDVNDPFRSIIEVPESIGNNNEEFKFVKRTVSSNANDNNVVSKTVTARHLNKRGAKNTFIEDISDIIHWQSILHSPDNCLINEYKVNLRSKEKLNILRKSTIKTFFFVYAT